MTVTRKKIAIALCTIATACLFVLAGCGGSGSSSSATSASSSESASGTSASSSVEASSSAAASSSASASTATSEPANIGENGVYVIKKSHLERGDGLVADATYNLDDHGNVKSVDVVITGNEADNAALVYKRDGNGFAQSAGRQGGATMPYAAELDENGRLAKLTGMHNFTRTFSYNDAGKLATYAVTGGFQGKATYDDNGNLANLTMGSNSLDFAWDVDENGHLTGGTIAGRIPVEVTSDSNGNPTQLVASTDNEVLYKIDVEYAAIADPSQAARELRLSPTELIFGESFDMFNFLVK